MSLTTRRISRNEVISLNSGERKERVRSASDRFEMAADILADLSNDDYWNHDAVVKALQDGINTVWGKFCTFTYYYEVRQSVNGGYFVQEKVQYCEEMPESTWNLYL